MQVPARTPRWTGVVKRRPPPSLTPWLSMWLITMCAMAWGCTNDGGPVQVSELTELVFVCQQSQEVFVGKARTTPAAHPATGQPTLMPGLYCERCRVWRAGLPVEQLQRSPEAANCPKTRQPMSLTGPPPTSANRLPDPDLP
jgi:hypothetical protein